MTPVYLEQSLMETRLLEKLLYDKRKELSAYDVQLEEYCKLSAQRAAAGAQPLVPGFSSVSIGSGAALRGVLPGGVSTASGARAGYTAASQKVLLEKLLAEKKAELAAATAEVDKYTTLLDAKAASSTTTSTSQQRVSTSEASLLTSGADSASSASLDERVKSLEAMLVAELKRKEEQALMNEELLRANKELMRKLQNAQQQDGSGKREALPTVTYRAGDAPPVKEPAFDGDMLVVQTADGAEVAYKKLGTVLERPSGLGIVALGLASAIVPAASAAVSAVQEAVNSKTDDRR